MQAKDAQPLQTDQHQTRPLIQRTHRLAQNCALGLLIIGHSHSVDGHIRGGQQVTRLEGTK